MRSRARWASLSLALLAPPAFGQAQLPFVTLEAEDGTTSGNVIGPSREFGTIAAEASGRRAVRLERAEDELAVVLPQAADGLTVRYAVPDGSEGKLAVFADRKRVATLPLTARYAWFYGSYPFSNDPRQGGAHHFFDHVRVRLDQVLPAGTRLSFQLEVANPGGWTVIDLVDLERVPQPKPKPPGALSVIDFGADPTGARRADSAFRRAVARGRATGRPVWIPPGRYWIDSHLIVDRVTLAGAGHWHSVLQGRGIGIYGKRAPHGSSEVTLRDFAVIGEVAGRKDHEQVNAVGGALNRSLIEDLWLQHTKVGIWLDGPMDRVAIRRVRILDQTADGINFHGGVTNSVVEDSFVRNVGDDGLAMWSHRTENFGNAFRRNTVVAPILANGIAIYGGRDIEVSGNLVADTLTRGGGIHLGTRFDATPFAGTIRILDNRVVRGGSFDPNWKFGVGAFWIYALDHPIAAMIQVRNLALVDSSLEAIQFLGKPVTGVSLEDVRIDGAGSYGFQLQAPGEAVARNVVARGLGHVGVASDQQRFRLIDGGGNSGWETSAPFAPQP